MAGHTWTEIDGITYIAWPEQGCFVEKGRSPEDVGALYGPMNLDGTMDVDSISEIAVAYSQA